MIMAENKKKVLIIGSDSGLGRSLYNKLKKNKYDVFATSRRKKREGKILLNLKNISKNLYRLKKYLKNIKFDYIFFVAATTNSSKEIKNKNCTFGNFIYSDFVKLLEINCFSNLKIFEFLKKQNNLEKNSKIIFFTSQAGSITSRGKLKHNKPFGNLFYRISKAALNCGVKNLSYDFQNEYTILALHPGYVKTKSGGKNADFTITYATDKIFKLLEKINKKYNGSFIDLNGKKLKW